MSNIKKNFIYNFVYQLLILIIPLILTPYLSRVLGAAKLGEYAYTYSLASYFMIFISLGLNNYGNRTIAKCRDNKDELAKSFCEIYAQQLFFGVLCSLIYCFFVLNSSNYKIYYLILYMFILSSILDINWFFFGIEKFKITLIRNSIVKCLNIILIFIFVKSPSDVYIYTLIMAGMTLLSQLILWNCLMKEIKIIKIKIRNIIKHIKPNFILFIPVIAISIYKIMDKIMLGNMCEITEVAYYENAEKIIGVPMTLITTLGTIMLPKISNMVSKGDTKLINKYIEKSIIFLMFLSLPMCFGLISIGKEFAPLYFGVGFEKSGLVLQILGITLPFLSMANIIRTQYLIPNEEDFKFIISVFLGAIVNLAINFLLIPWLGSVGAAIGTVAAEFSVMAFQLFVVRKVLDIKKYIKVFFRFLIFSSFMYIMIEIIDIFKLSNVLKILLKLFVGCIIYLFTNIRYINSLVKIDSIMRRTGLEYKKNRMD